MNCRTPSVSKHLSVVNCTFQNHESISGVGSCLFFEVENGATFTGVIRNITLTWNNPSSSSEGVIVLRNCVCESIQAVKVSYGVNADSVAIVCDFGSSMVSEFRDLSIEGLGSQFSYYQGIAVMAPCELCGDIAFSNLGRAVIFQGGSGDAKISYGGFVNVNVGVYVSAALSLTLDRCDFQGSQAESESLLHFETSAIATLTFCCFQGEGPGSDIGGLGLITLEPGNSFAREQSRSIVGVSVSFNDVPCAKTVFGMSFCQKECSSYEFTLSDSITGTEGFSKTGDLSSTVRFPSSQGLNWSVEFSDTSGLHKSSLISFSASFANSEGPRSTLVFDGSEGFPRTAVRSESEPMSDSDRHRNSVVLSGSSAANFSKPLKQTKNFDMSSEVGATSSLSLTPVFSVSQEHLGTKVFDMSGSMNGTRICSQTSPFSASELSSPSPAFSFSNALDISKGMSPSAVHLRSNAFRRTLVAVATEELSRSDALERSDVMPESDVLSRGDSVSSTMKFTTADPATSSHILVPPTATRRTTNIVTEAATEIPEATGLTPPNPSTHPPERTEPPLATLAQQSTIPPAWTASPVRTVVRQTEIPVQPGQTAFSTVIVPSTHLPAASDLPVATVPPVSTNLPRQSAPLASTVPLATAIPASSVVVVPVESDGEAVGSDEKGDSIGLLIAAILAMVLVCGLFAYLIYMEERRKSERLQGPPKVA
jgi:hypothetical protein